METQTQSQVARTGRKISAEIVRLSSLKPQESVKGTFLKETERKIMDRETGEEKMVTQYLFEGEKKDRFFVLADAGLKNAILASGVSVGDKIEIVKKESVDLGNDRSVNQYDIYLN